MWRNTHLENVHAGSQLTVGAGEAEAALAEWERRIDPSPLGLRSVADPAERSRLGTFVASRAEGYPIPDDVMLRLNTATAEQVRLLLGEVLDAQVTLAGAIVAGDTPEGMPDYMSAAFEFFSDPGRLMWVGCVAMSVADVLGTTTIGGTLARPGLVTYLADVERGIGRLLGLSDLIGGRRALWVIALSGASYASRFFPLPYWAAGVASVIRNPHTTQAKERQQEMEIETEFSKLEVRVAKSDLPLSEQQITELLAMGTDVVSVIVDASGFTIREAFDATEALRAQFPAHCLERRPVSLRPLPRVNRKPRVGVSVDFSATPVTPGDAVATEAEQGGIPVDVRFAIVGVGKTAGRAARFR